MASDSNIALSVSVTTRKPRPGEVDGKDYFFIDDAEFQRRRAAGELLEWAPVFENPFYGTPKAAVADALAAGRDVLFDIDWQGAQQLNEQMPQDLVRVFILPPDVKTLELAFADASARYARGGGGTDAEGSGRNLHWPEYDYVVINRDVEESHRHLTAILTAGGRSAGARLG